MSDRKPRVPHPSERMTLPVTALVAAGLGTLIVLLHPHAERGLSNWLDGWHPLTFILACGLFAIALAAAVLSMLAWVLREHAYWRYQEM